MISVFFFLLTDSDYQLGSGVQTPAPGLNNSELGVEYETPGQHITPMTEAYIARDRSASAYASQPVS